MPAITSLDLSNAKLDVDHIAAIATSTAPTATDRLGNSKLTVLGAVTTLKAFNPRGGRVNGTTYNLKDLYTESGTTYVTVVNSFNSVSVASDLTSGNVTIHQGATNESVDAHFSLFELASYSAIRSYTGVQNRLDIIAPSLAGTFVRVVGDSTTPDDSAINIRTTSGVLFRRQFVGGVDIRWWGAKFDGITDDTSAVQACLNYAVPLQLQIILPSGAAKITAPININVSNNGLNMVGQGYQKTRFNYSSLTSGQSLFVLNGYPGAVNGATVSGIGFDGNSGTNAFALVGSGGQLIEKCQFGANAFACLMNNNTTGLFTEFNVLRDCDFLLGCHSAIWYLVSGTGDASFHGSGIEGGTINNNGINSVLVLSSAAYPYNAPFSPTIFVHVNVTIISYPVSAGAFRPNFFGTLKLEVQAGRALLCDAPAANAIAYVGKVLSQSSNVEFGSFFMCDGVFSAASGSRQTIGGRISRTQALTTGANTLPAIPYNIMEGCVFIALRVVGPNYEYRMVLSCWGSGVGGTVVVVATPGVFNVAGYGPPVVTLNGTNQIVITNAGYPATGISCRVDIQQIGQSPFSTFVP